jgi:Fe-S-cluster containining protein
MKRHRQFLADVGRWFDSVRRTQGDRMQCGRGCALCCHGLFDISLPDALELARGLALLPPAVFEEVRSKADETQRNILSSAPELKPPYFLKVLSDRKVDEVVANAHARRCPLLGSNNECLAYEYRPLACRLEGIPMVDSRDGLFGDWCELNFSSGVPEEIRSELRQDYYELQNVEDIATEILSEAVLNEKHSQLTVFIPSVIVEIDFWKRLM